MTIVIDDLREHRPLFTLIDNTFYMKKTINTENIIFKYLIVFSVYHKDFFKLKRNNKY